MEKQVKFIKDLVNKKNGFICCGTPSLSAPMYGNFVKITDIHFEHFDYFLKNSIYFIEKMALSDVRMEYIDFNGDLGISCEDIPEQVNICNKNYLFIKSLMEEIFKNDIEFKENFELMFSY